MGFWKWLDKVKPGQIGLVEDARGKLLRPLRLASNVLVENSPEPIALANLKSTLEQYTSLELTSDSPRAAYVESFRVRFGDLAAAAAVAQYLRSSWGPDQNTPSDNRYGVELGRLAILLFELGLGKGVNPAFRSSFEKITAAFNTRAEQQFADSRSELAAIQLERERSEVSQKEMHGAFEQSWNSMLERVESEAKAAISSIENTEAAFKQQMKLRASVTYWSTQSSTHLKRGHLQKVILLGYGIAIAAAGFWAAPPFFEVVKSTAVDLEGKSTTPLLMLTGVGIFLISIALWGARILVRIYMEERHRAMDAAERAIMAETYSALTDEGLVSDAERVLVLSSMFRPAGESSNRDDGPETLQHAILAKLLDSKAAPKP
ncbi:DUF6161 domain-containing protein [Hyphomicrobium sp.]|uniref:DUF6161 domain-containing protein n=1 Tax=Hyphomicrobium sp. TaxID=82 RepID=UPI002B55DC56|nr:DUF6161 domain-containing protein [Hyphomicrobium sp.]HRQ25650.1 DUF6161 domain-containing protein [Hyphomicrobium sp.]